MKNLNCLECNVSIESGEYCALCAPHMITKEEGMCFRTKAEEKAFIDAWWKENGHLVEDLVELDLPFMQMKAIEQFYMEIGLYTGRKPSSGVKGSEEQYMENTGLSVVYEKAGYMEYECDRCGEVYDYEPKVCTVKDDQYGISCGCTDFTVNHGPFEGVYIAHQEAIQCGDFQGLARHSAFEEGCNFNDVADIDEYGIFHGYCQESSIVEDRYAPANSELENFKSLIEYRKDQAAKLQDYLDKIERHIARKLKGLSYDDAKGLIISFIGEYVPVLDDDGNEVKLDNGKPKLDFIQGILHYGIQRYFSDWGWHYKHGTVYMTERVYSEDGTYTVRNTLERRAMLDRLIHKWAEVNSRTVRNKQEQLKPHVNELAWNKFIELYVNMPDNMCDKLDLITSGKLDLTEEEAAMVVTHCQYRVYKLKQVGLPTPVYRALRQYKQRVGA